MSEPRRGSWLSFLLFWLTLAVAAALILLVILAPLLDNRRPNPRGWARWLAVFAQDAVVRRVAVASALGLVVTACIFFRPPTGPRPPAPKTSSPPRLPPPESIVGA